MEASLQQGFALNHFAYYLFVYAATVLYYTHAYLAEKSSDPANLRAYWYTRQRKSVQVSQLILTAIVLYNGIGLLVQIGPQIQSATVLQWTIAGIFPLAAILYYGSAAPLHSTHSLRNNGWLKPFVIGFVWAGAVTVYPVMFQFMEKKLPYTLQLIHVLLFIKNMMFITMLCILFDIKDYAADHNQQLKTFVVQLGLRKTLFQVIIPLSIIGLGTFLVYAFYHQFSAGRMVFNTIPFILLITVTHTMHRRQSILYYLAIIDGLMLVKAICGIIGTSFT